MCKYARDVAADSENLKEATKDHFKRCSSDGNFRISDDPAGLSGIPVTLLRL